MPDPIHGKSVSVSDLKLSTAEDAMKYIQRYNNVVEKKATNDDAGADKDSSVEGGQEGNGADFGGSPDGPSAGKGKKKDGAGAGEGTSNGTASRVKSDRAQRTKEKLKRNNGADSHKS